jgi:hypothetical protein
MTELRNFGPLLPKINGQEFGKFIYLRLNYIQGTLEIISIEDESNILVNIVHTNKREFLHYFVDHTSGIISRIQKKFR